MEFIMKNIYFTAYDQNVFLHYTEGNNKQVTELYCIAINAGSAIVIKRILNNEAEINKEFYLTLK